MIALADLEGNIMFIGPICLDLLHLSPHNMMACLSYWQRHQLAVGSFSPFLRSGNQANNYGSLETKQLKVKFSGVISFIIAI